MLRPAVALLLACLCCAPVACADEAAAPAAATPAAARSVWVALGGETFSLELAVDPATRMQGLSGRDSIGRNAGMLFVFPREAPRAMVMRDCPQPIDVAFLDAGGRVVALAAMRAEPPRRPDEPRGVYEARLPVYASGVPARFAIEVAGGRLAELGIAVGDPVALDTAALIELAR